MSFSAGAHECRVWISFLVVRWPPSAQRGAGIVFNRRKRTQLYDRIVKYNAAWTRRGVTQCCQRIIACVRNKLHFFDQYLGRHITYKHDRLLANVIYDLTAVTNSTNL